jgi:hypothetical protein
MKRRDGFVSNSSSSSFLVASNKEANDIEMTVTLNVKMSEITDNTITDKKDLIQHYNDNWGFETEKEILAEKDIADEYKRCIKALEEGKMIHVVVISTDGGAFEYALYDGDQTKLPESKHYKVISK